MTTSANARQAYIVGGGIAGLAAAAYLVRDGGMAGPRIHLLEQSDCFGGSLDSAGDPDSGYVIRGGRMFEQHFGCTFDLLSSIPSLSDPAVSASDELHAFTRRIVTSSKSRIVVNGKKVEAPPLDLSPRDRWDLARLSLLPEHFLSSRAIEDYFGADFFDSNFWIMWSTMFAFQRWHSLIEFRRYMRRFMHLMPGFNPLEGIHRTTNCRDLVQPVELLVLRHAELHLVEFYDSLVISFLRGILIINGLLGLGHCSFERLRRAAIFACLLGRALGCV